MPYRRWLTGLRDGRAGELKAETAPIGFGVSGWSSSAAVNTVHAGATATAEALAARMQITAAKIAAADASIVAHEAGSSDALAAVGNSVTV